MYIEPMTGEHISKVVEIEQIAGLTPWSADDYARVLTAQDRWTAWIARSSKADGGLIVGFALVLWLTPEVELSKIAVDPSWQGKGMGSRLLRAVLDEAERRECFACYLEVRQSNRSAIRLYKRHGFEIQGRRRKYYQEPAEDAWVMRRSIPLAEGG